MDYNGKKTFFLSVVGEDLDKHKTIFSKSTSDFQFAPKTASIFTQTDKAIYRPRELSALCNFYVEVVDMNFRSEIILSNIKFYLYSGMWKRKRWKRLIFCGSGSGSTLMKEVGSGSELESESVEKEPKAEAVFSKSGASGFSIWLQPLG